MLCVRAGDVRLTYDCLRCEPPPEHPDERKGAPHENPAQDHRHHLNGCGSSVPCVDRARLSSWRRALILGLVFPLSVRLPRPALDQFGAGMVPALTRCDLGSAGAALLLARWGRRARA